MPPPGRRRSASLLILYSIILICISLASAASSVLGIDLGTEYIKAALVKPGIPLEIVLTKDSKRKEASVIALKPLKPNLSASDPDAFPERVYGGDALALSARFPGDVYPNLKPLLGLTYSSNPVVAEYKGIHPGLRIKADKDRGTVAFSSDSFGGKDSFMVEELLAMELQNIKGNAEAFAGKSSTIRDVVITVPAFYTAEEKWAVETAADLAGLRILALTTDGLSVGLHYATSRTFPVPAEGAKPEYHLVYDMGAGSTTATVLRFQGKTVKDVGKFNKTIQDVQVMGVGWDRNLGGDTFNAVIMDDMIAKLLETKRMKTLGVGVSHIKEHGRTMAKLWKEAERMRQVLSANTETSTSFEGLYYDDVNFKYKISRVEFEDLVATYAARTRNPISQALSMAKMELGSIESIILHGGAVRSPFVQKELETFLGSAEKLRTNVNSDEAAVFGAAFKAAGISPSFRVKEIQATDIAVHPVTLSWAYEGREKQQKLFVPSSLVGAEKQIPFKITEDFSFRLSQQSSEDSVNPRDVPVIQVQTQNLTASVKELADKFGCTPTDVSTKFWVRLSPINALPEAIRGSVSCEVADLEKKGGVVDDVKGFFGFGSKKGSQVPLSDDEDTGSTTSDSDTESSTTSSITTSSTLESKITTSSSPADKDAEKTKDVKRKIETINIAFSTAAIGLPQIGSTEMIRIKERMDSFDASDRSRRLREEAFNTLEGYTYKVRDLVDDEAFVAASTKEQRSEIEEKSKSASEWLYGDGADATRETLKLRLKELRDLVDPIQKRKDEVKKRPEEIRLLKEVLDQTKALINVMKEQSETASRAAAMASSSSSLSAAEATASSSSVVNDDFAGLDDEPATAAEPSASTQIPEMPPMPFYSEEDLASLTGAYESVQTWLEEKLEQQDKLSPTDDPVISSTELATKSKELNTIIVELLQKKMKIPPKGKSSSKSKVKKAKSSKKSKGSTSTTAADDASSSTDMPASEQTRPQSSVVHEDL